MRLNEIRVGRRRFSRATRGLLDESVLDGKLRNAGDATDVGGHARDIRECDRCDAEIGLVQPAACSFDVGPKSTVAFGRGFREAASSLASPRRDDDHAWL